MQKSKNGICILPDAKIQRKKYFDSLKSNISDSNLSESNVSDFVESNASNLSESNVSEKDLFLSRVNISKFKYPVYEFYINARGKKEIPSKLKLVNLPLSN